MNYDVVYDTIKLNINVDKNGDIMRSFNYKDRWQKLLTPQTVAMMTMIHEFKGEQNLFIESKADVLTSLLEIAKIQSTEASNKIEGIYTSDERIKKLVYDKTTPQTRNEQEIAGYRDVLATIHENYDYIPANPSMILQLHRDLYKYSGANGGRYKIGDNIISEQLATGERRVRFRPVSAWETPDAMNELCRQFDEICKDTDTDPLLTIPMFILDFLCIHPFNDGNGRMSRLLTLLLLYRSGYIVGKYISIERLIEQSKETYYESLQASSLNWHEEENDYAPFVNYMLGVIVAAYREFSERIKVLTTSNMSKPDRVRELIKSNYGPITKTEIVNKCPDISKITVERALKDLHESGQITKLGGGRGTKYVWNWENDK